MPDSNSAQELAEQKRALRRTAYERRNAQTEREELSQAIFRSVVALPEYRAASTVMWYLHCRSEVQTQAHVQSILGGDKRVVVPHCREDVLDLFLLEDMEELEPGTWSILEPRADLRDRPGKRIDPAELDFIVVPGVAFDRHGGRVGNGKGYYDKLLEAVRENTARVAVCFESQLFPEVPTDAHDVRMHKLVTEHGVYDVST